MKKELKKAVKKATRRLPGIQSALRKGMHSAQRISNSVERGFVNSDPGNAPKYRLMIPLPRITHCNQIAGVPGSTPPLSTISGESIVARGDWDQSRLRLEEMPLYQSIQQYLLEGKDLQETPIYMGHAEDDAQITAGSWHAVYAQNLEAKKAKIDMISHSLKEKGYLSQADLKSDRPHDEITVRIARDGQILLENSIHRTIIAKLLGIEMVPVVVSARHADWLATRSRFLEFAHNRENGSMYGKLSHPDLWDIPHAHALDDRIALVSKHLLSNTGNALDLGCDTGLFSQFLSQAGHDVWAVERDPDLASIAKLMSDIEGLGVHFIVGDILDHAVATQYQGRSYSVVLALNILHHFLKKQERVEKLTSILQSLEMDQLFLQCHRQDEPQMQNAYMNPSPEEFAQFIVDNSCLTRWVEIGAGTDGRMMMTLSKA